MTSMTGLEFEDRAPQLIGVAIGFVCLATTCFLLRVYVRVFLTRSFGLDDWFLTGTMSVFIPYIAFVIDGATKGTGKHIGDRRLTMTGASAALETWYISELLYIIATTLMKVSAGAMFLRITTVRAHRLLIWSVIVVAVFFGIIFFFLVAFQCQPISFFWDVTRNPAHGRCISDKATTGFSYAHAAIVAASDWTYSIFPFFLFRKLNMDRRTKISTSLVLVLANIGSIATLIRIKDIKEIFTNIDFLFNATNLAIWSTVEAGMGIAALSMSTFRPLFRSFFGHRDASPNRSGSSASFRKLKSPLRKVVTRQIRWPTRDVNPRGKEKSLPSLPSTPSPTYHPRSPVSPPSNRDWRRDDMTVSDMYPLSESASTIKVYGPSYTDPRMKEADMI